MKFRQFSCLTSCYRHPGDNSVSNLGSKMAFLEAAHYKKPWQNVSLSPGEQVTLYQGRRTQRLHRPPEAVGRTQLSLQTPEQPKGLKGRTVPAVIPLNIWCTESRTAPTLKQARGHATPLAPLYITAWAVSPNLLLFITKVLEHLEYKPRGQAASHSAFLEHFPSLGSTMATPGSTGSGLVGGTQPARHLSEVRPLSLKAASCGKVTWLSSLPLPSSPHYKIVSSTNF